MEQARPRQAPFSKRPDPDQAAKDLDSKRLKSEMNQHVDQFLSAFDADYRKTIRERDVKKTPDA